MAYTGNVARLPIGIQGFSGSRNPTQLQAGHLEYVEGLSLDGGLIQKEGGASKLNASALGSGAAVLSGISYSPLADTHRDAVFLSDGSILKDSGLGTFPVTLASGLNSATQPPPWFLMGGGETVGAPRTLFCFSATNQVRAVDGDGAVMAAITTPPADWAGSGNFPTFGVIHEDRLWGGGNATDPHRIYYSTLSDHQNFTGTGSGTLAVFPGEGERIVGATSFKGLLVVFKYPRGIYMVTTSDPSPAGWRVDRLSGATGGLNQHTIIPIDNDTMYMSASGSIHLLSATDAFGDAETSTISLIADINEFVRNYINVGALRNACGLWYSYKNQAWIALPQSNETENNIRLIVDLSATNSVGPRFLLSRRDTPISMWMRPNTETSTKPAHGDSDGFIWNMDTDARSKDGVGYPVAFQSANMDLSFIDPSLATLNKTGDFLELIFEPQGDWDLTVQVSWDDVPGPPLLYTMGGSGAPLGAFILDTDELASTAIKSIRKRIAGSGRRIRIMANNEVVDQNIAISDFYLSFRTMDERSR